MKTRLKKGVLKVLEAWDGPMPETSLLSAVQAHALSDRPTVSDVQAAVRDCESGGYIQGVTVDEFSGRSWSLTEKGLHQVRRMQ